MSDEKNAISGGLENNAPQTADQHGKLSIGDQLAQFYRDFSAKALERNRSMDLDSCEILAFRPGNALLMGAIDDAAKILDPSKDYLLIQGCRIETGFRCPGVDPESARKREKAALSGFAEAVQALSGIDALVGVDDSAAEFNRRMASLADRNPHLVDELDVLATQASRQIQLSLNMARACQENGQSDGNDIVITAPAVRTDPDSGTVDIVSYAFESLHPSRGVVLTTTITPDGKTYRGFYDIQNSESMELAFSDCPEVFGKMVFQATAKAEPIENSRREEPAQKRAEPTIEDVFDLRDR